MRDPSSWLDAVVIPLLLLFILLTQVNLDSASCGWGFCFEQQSRGAGFHSCDDRFTLYDATISDNRHELIENAGRTHSRTGGDSGGFRAANGAPVTVRRFSVITDGSEPNTANFVQGYAGRHLANLATAAEVEDRGGYLEPLIDVQTRYRLTRGDQSVFLSFPAVTIIMTVLAQLTSLVAAPRMGARRTMEALFQPK